MEVSSLFAGGGGFLVLCDSVVVGGSPMGEQGAAFPVLQRMGGRRRGQGKVTHGFEGGRRGA